MQHKNKTVAKSLEILNLILTHEKLNLNELARLERDDVKVTVRQVF